MDGIGAYDHISRTRMLTEGSCACRKLTSACPSSVCFMPARHAKSGTAKPARTPHHPPSRRGRTTRPGDPLMPALYCLGKHAALAAIQQQLHPTEALYAFLDDVYLVVSFQRVSDVLGIVQHHLPTHAHVHLHQVKVKPACGMRPAELHFPFTRHQQLFDRLHTLDDLQASWLWQPPHTWVFADTLRGLLQTDGLSAPAPARAHLPFAAGGLGLVSATCTAPQIQAPHLYDALQPGFTLGRTTLCPSCRQCSAPTEAVRLGLTIPVSPPSSAPSSRKAHPGILTEKVRRPKSGPNSRSYTPRRPGHDQSGSPRRAVSGICRSIDPSNYHAWPFLGRPPVPVGPTTPLTGPAGPTFSGRVSELVVGRSADRPPHEPGPPTSQP